MSEPHVRLRRDVPEDLHSIVAWLDQYSPAVSDHFVDAVFAALDDLAATPGKGSPKQFSSRRLEGIRSWSVPGFRNFLILYRPISEGIDVLAIVHGARDLRTLLLKRL